MGISLKDIIERNENAHLSFENKGSSSFREIQKCLCCEGEGSVRVSEFKGHARGYEEEEIECINCKGSGLIEVFVTITRKPFKPKKNG